MPGNGFFPVIFQMPHVMRLATLTGISLSIPAALAMGLVWNVLSLSDLNERLSRARQTAQDSIILADRLRQSSDDLTRMVRTHVVTGNPAYRRYFNLILDMRNGTAARAAGYDGVYWDFILPGEREPDLTEEAVSLQELMRRAGFQEDEFALLREAQKRSDALVALEREAMALVEKGRAAGERPRDGPLFARARELVHDTAYHRAKSEIMTPIDHFLDRIRERSETELLGLEREQLKLVEWTWILLAVTLLSLASAGLLLYRAILVPIGVLTERTGRIANHDYRARVPPQGTDELGRLAGAFNTMAEVINSDIHRREEREQELVRLRQAAEEANQDLEEFAHVASHDLQEPLRTMNNYAEFLKEDLKAEYLDDAVREDLRFISEAAARMQRLVRDLLAYSRSGRLEIKPRPVALETCMTTVVENLGGSIRESGADVHWSDLPTVQGDATALTSVLQNLVGNALKFHRPDVTPEVRIASERERDQWRIRIADNGIGMEEHHLERIFQPFKRLHGEKAFPGTGLGLAIVKKIVERHGGTVTAASTPGEGSLFILKLPAWTGETSTPENHDEDGKT